MNKLIVVGMGAGSKEFLTLEAYKVLSGSKLVYARTLKHPVVDYLIDEGVNFESFDYLYDKLDNFDRVYEAIVNNILDKLKEEDVVYAVTGNPFVAERTVEILDEKSKQLGFDVEYIYGTSFIDAIINSLRKDPVYGLRIQDALRLDKFIPSIREDNVFVQVYDKLVASELKIELSKYYLDTHMVKIIKRAGIPNEEKIIDIELYKLDRVDEFDHLTSVYVPAYKDDTKYTFFDFVKIIEILRSPNGCAWDRKQNHDTMKNALIEECYEVLDAIDRYDIDNMVEELGDVLLQVVFHAQIGSEDGYFNIDDIVQAVSEKMVKRHPHVFGDMNIDDADEVLKNWDKIKREEKNQEFQSDVMSDLPKLMPTLLRAEKIQKLAAKLGFDWDDSKGAMLKLREEIDEVNHELQAGNKDELAKEIGDVIFSIVNVARMEKINPEIALESTNRKFIERFRFIEQELKTQNKNMSDMDLEQLDLLWEKAKVHLK